MISLTSFSGKRVGVLGLGSSGLSVVRSLESGGANVMAWDDNIDTRQKLDIPLTDLSQIDFAILDSLIISPSIPLTHPSPHVLVEKAHESNVEVIGDMELFAREYNSVGSRDKIIAITGTNGKSTTVALLSHILRSSGFDSQMGGNIGFPILDLSSFSSDGSRFYVLECSSYQLELCPSLRPQIGVLLNITPDHIDRHGTFENYASIKRGLLSRSESTIIGTDISLIDFPPTPFLLGSHNARNVSVVRSVCDILDLDSSSFTDALCTFRGLPHRMQHIGTVGSIIFINDSKSTNADATAPALSGLSNIYWIAGGIAKSGGIESLSPYFSRITKAYLYGESSQLFSAQLSCDVSHDIFATLSDAFTAAVRDANLCASESIILFSPCASSFDQFSNFESRGESFVSLVSSLDNFTPFGSCGQVDL